MDFKPVYVVWGEKTSWMEVQADGSEMKCEGEKDGEREREDVGFVIEVSREREEEGKLDS